MLVAPVKKYSGSHRELHPAGAEYKINDGLLRNLAAHSGLPYFGGLDHLEINKSFLLYKDGIQYLFKLKGVIHFSENHSTSRIITQNGQMWFHDDITLQHEV